MEVGSLVGWEKAEGELVEEGDVLARVETDKASMEMEAPHTGYVAKIVVPEGTRDIPLGKVGVAGGRASSRKEWGCWLTRGVCGKWSAAAFDGVLLNYMTGGEERSSLSCSLYDLVEAHGYGFKCQ